MTNTQQYGVQYIRSPKLYFEYAYGTNSVAQNHSLIISSCKYSYIAILETKQLSSLIKRYL